MSRTGKIILIISSCLFLLVAGVVAAGLYWWSHNSQRIFEAGQKTIEDGEKFGKNTDEQGCVAEAVSRYKADSGFTGSIKASLFMRSCLENSRPTPGFCDSVPKQSEILKSAQWQLEQANKAGISDSFGKQLFSEVQRYCEAKGARTKSPPPSTPATP